MIRHQSPGTHDSACGKTRNHFLLSLPAILLLAVNVQGEEPVRPGLEVYQRLCARCHGEQGEGVKDECEDPLRGAHSIDELAQIIDETMPEDDPEKCQGKVARQVAAYIHSAFYTKESRGEGNVPRIALSRLTVRQYEQSMADLMATFWGEGSPNGTRGLKATYYNDRGFRREKKVLDRVDDEIDFNFGEESPLKEKIGKEAFAIQWIGSIVAEDTGDYEFTLTTENGARLWVNDGEEALIDAWVQSGDETEHRATVRLLGGRIYHLRLDYFKFKQKSASVRLEWQPPHRARAVVPARNLSQARAPRVFVVTTPFPPDDSSVGYERGTYVSEAWDQATVYAALEAADLVAANLESLAGLRPAAADRREKVKAFCYRFVERAFRRPLTPEQKVAYVDDMFEQSEDIESAVKKTILRVLQSPSFLYVGIASEQLDGYHVAERLAFGLWDSLPDRPLLQAAAAGRLNSAEQVAAQAERMLANARTRAKTRVFFQKWLKYDRADDLSKDKKKYPDFSSALTSDLRTSLDLFLDDVIWSESSDFRQLLLADYMYVNHRLAEYYGCTSDDRRLTEDRFDRVPCDPKQRAGVLTHPFLMAAFAYHKTSSPIHRGVFIVRSLVGRSLKPPPIAVAPLDPGAQPNLTTRERVALQTKATACQTCHSLINPLGFTLEHYDAVGRFRTVEGKNAVDASGSYKSLSGETAEFKGARDLAMFLANSPEVHRSIVEQLFHYVVKQPVVAFGPSQLDELCDSFRRSKFSIKQLLVEILKRSALRVGPSESEDVT